MLLIESVMLWLSLDLSIWCWSRSCWNINFLIHNLRRINFDPCCRSFQLYRLELLYLLFLCFLDNCLEVKVTLGVDMRNSVFYLLESFILSWLLIGLPCLLVVRRIHYLYWNLIDCININLLCAIAILAWRYCLKICIVGCLNVVSLSLRRFNLLNYLSTLHIVLIVQNAENWFLTLDDVRALLHILLVH